MTAHHIVVLTDKEHDELITLLNMVLTNADQWDLMDLPALRRVARKADAS